MKTILITIVTLTIFLTVSGCSEHSSSPNVDSSKIETSGKKSTDLAKVPKEVLAAAKAARPDLSIVETEHEVRDGNEYYDVGGTIPDGSELELDMMFKNGAWTVVEVQRDIDMSLVPQAVREALDEHAPNWISQRIIESDQGDGIVIYELFGHQGSGESQKKEIKWENGRAEMLVDEWVH